MFKIFEMLETTLLFSP